MQRLKSLWWQEQRYYRTLGARKWALWTLGLWGRRWA